MKATVDSLIGVAWGVFSVGLFVAAAVDNDDTVLAAGFAAAVLCVLYRILGELESRSAERGDAA